MMDKYQRDVKCYEIFSETIILLFKGMNITATEFFATSNA